MPELKDELVCRQSHSLSVRIRLSGYPIALADRINPQRSYISYYPLDKF
ncbi:hypothetical protein [Microcoleus sp. FACHB-68]|nr:hypothetical protein [Microcoleus sp. FACHB-68]MBD1939566.1 hypothetical protein [Microcoleus sp. FACHB-68]